jgi:hypothetical protein
MLSEYPLCCCRQAVDDSRLSELLFIATFGFCAVPGSDQNALFHAGVLPALGVYKFVANHIAPGQVEAEFIAGIEQKLGGRLSAAARPIRSLKRGIDFFEPHAFFAQVTTKARIHFFHFGHTEVAAPDAGLVGNDEELEAVIQQCFQSGAYAGEDDDVFRAAEIIFIDNQRPVAIEENSGVHSAGRLAEAEGESYGRVC